METKYIFILLLGIWVPITVIFDHVIRIHIWKIIMYIFKRVIEKSLSEPMSMIQMVGPLQGKCL